MQALPNKQRPLRRTVAGLATMLLSLAVTVAVQFATALPAPALVNNDVTAAASYAASTGTHGAVVVLDTQASRIWAAGDYDGTTFASESIIKAFIAARLLVTGQMSGDTAAVAWKMITQSDDASADALYGRVGGDSLITWVATYYNIPFLGSPPSQPGWWGNTHVTARGYAYFLAKARFDPLVGPWLLNAMHHATYYGSDGFYQWFGIAQATTGAALKQGWGDDNDAANATELNSTGFVQNDRYVVVIFTQHAPEISFDTMRSIIDSTARRVMPAGRLDLPENHNPIGHVDQLSATGNTLTAAGWAIDPDIYGSRMTVAVYRGTSVLTVIWADQPRPDVNRVTGYPGNHGFSVSLVVPDGLATYCVELRNTSLGTASPRTCYVLNVSGRPVGYLDAVTPEPGSVRLAGWSLDPDVPNTPSTVFVAEVRDRMNDSIGFLQTSLNRPDVNRAYHVSGLHGFVIGVAASVGTHTYCVWSMNQGPPDVNPLMGCATVTVTSAAVARAQVPGSAGASSRAPTSTAPTGR